MVKVECSRCAGGKGHINAFNHVMRGVCFKCHGKGYVEQKSKPRPSITFVVYGLWDDPNDCNYNNGEYIRVGTVKARSQKQADGMMEARSEKVGAHFYAEPA